MHTAERSAHSKLKAVQPLDGGWEAHGLLQGTLTVHAPWTPVRQHAPQFLHRPWEPGSRGDQGLGWLAMTFQETGPRARQEHSGEQDS